MSKSTEAIKNEQARVIVAEKTDASAPAANAQTAKKDVAAAAPAKSVFRDYFESFVVTLIMAFFGMTFIVQAVTVPTGSMQNTIMIGDHLLVNKFVFAPGPTLPFLPMREIRRGDIIVFKYPGNQHDPQEDIATKSVQYQMNFVKRVIGLPGDTIEFRDAEVYVNGKLLPEYRVAAREPREGAALTVKEVEPRDADDQPYTVYYDPRTLQAVKNGERIATDEFNFAVAGKPMKVPDNNYFVIGDSRDRSYDGRFWGFVPRDLIVGQAMFVYWSCDRSYGDSALDCLTHPRFERIGKLVK